MSVLFKCYSVPLMKYLVSNNIRFELVGKNPRTNKTFWAFLKNDDLSTHLTQWTLNKR